MQYEVTEIKDGIATIQFEDNSYIYIELYADMTEEDLDDAIYRILPSNLKKGEKPDFLQVGQKRTAREKEAEESADPRPKWLADRQDAYGLWFSQLEYITENGLEAWQEYVAKVKADNPKTSD